MTDWMVWPIFITQLVALILVVVNPPLKRWGISPRIIVMGILLAICVAIAASLYHDSTDALNLYF